MAQGLRSGGRDRIVRQPEQQRRGELHLPVEQLLLAAEAEPQDVTGERVGVVPGAFEPVPGLDARAQAALERHVAETQRLRLCRDLRGGSRGEKQKRAKAMHDPPPNESSGRCLPEPRKYDKRILISMEIGQSKKMTGMKTALMLGVPAGLVLGLALFTFGYARGSAYLTDNPEACANCHVMRVG